MLDRPHTKSWIFFPKRAVRFSDSGYPPSALPHPSLSQTKSFRHSFEKIETPFKPWIEAPSSFLLAGALCALISSNGQENFKSVQKPEKNDTGVLGC